MSAFDNIADAASRDEARVREALMPDASRVEVVVTPRHGFLALAGLLAVAGAAWWQGGAHERARFDSFVAEERRVADVERARQAAAAVEVSAEADRRVTAAHTDEAALQGRIDQYVAQLAARPVDARCSLTDADLRGLRDGPAAARPRRRPARAPRDAE